MLPTHFAIKPAKWMGHGASIIDAALKDCYSVPHLCAFFLARGWDTLTLFMGRIYRGPATRRKNNLMRSNGSR
jgi:hypothetical protein